MLSTTWVIKRGERFAPVYTYVDENGDAISLVGHTLTAYIRSGRSFDSPLVETLAVATVDASAGTYQPVLEDTETDDVAESVLDAAARWGQVWVTGPTTDNTPKQILEANPVSWI